jgi:hypothetical protein
MKTAKEINDALNAGFQQIEDALKASDEQKVTLNLSVVNHIIRFACLTLSRLDDAEFSQVVRLLDFAETVTITRVVEEMR